MQTRGSNFSKQVAEGKHGSIGSQGRFSSLQEMDDDNDSNETRSAEGRRAKRLGKAAEMGQSNASVSPEKRRADGSNGSGFSKQATCPMWPRPVEAVAVLEVRVGWVGPYGQWARLEAVKNDDMAIIYW